MRWFLRVLAPPTVDEVLHAVIRCFPIFIRDHAALRRYRAAKQVGLRPTFLVARVDALTSPPMSCGTRTWSIKM